MAKRKALGTPTEISHRQKQNRTRMAKKRSMNTSVDNAITTFLLKAKMGPDYVCTTKTEGPAKVLLFPGILMDIMALELRLPNEN